MGRARQNSKTNVNTRYVSKNKIQTRDSGLVNYEANLGQGANNLMSQGQYTAPTASYNHTQLENMYRTSWIIGRAVDTVADDMTREGIEFSSGLDGIQSQKLMNTIDELQIWSSLNQLIKWSRLYGGAAGIIIIEGQDLSTPLNLNTVGRGTFKGILVFDKWMIQPSVSRLISELGPLYGMPEFYELTNKPNYGQMLPDSNQLASVHHTRVLRFDGVMLPQWQRQTTQLWGASIIERIEGNLMALDSGTIGSAQLLFKSYLSTLKLNGYREIMAQQQGPAYDGLMGMLNHMRYMQRNEGLSVIDAQDEMQRDAYSFGGVSDVLAQLSQQISGAVEIPLVRLFGQSPTGFSTGDADLANYYDMIGSKQRSMLKMPLHKIFGVLFKSLFDKDMPDDFGFRFAPLWQMSAKEKAETAQSIVTTLADAVSMGIMPLHKATQEFKNSAEITGIGGSLDEEDINNAQSSSDEPPDIDYSKPSEV